jgi:hypothetical protein
MTATCRFCRPPLEAFANEGGCWRLLATLKDAVAVHQPPFGATRFDLSVQWPV